MAKARTAVATRGKPQVQAPQVPVQAQAPKGKDEAKAPKVEPPLGILKATSETNLTAITKVLGAAFQVTEPRSGGSFYRVRILPR